MSQIAMSSRRPTEFNGGTRRGPATEGSSDASVGLRPRSLAPKEHGAWGQLIIPLVVSAGLGRPTLAAVSFAIAAFAAFLAHEPLLVLLGQRGTRAAREASQPAKSRLTKLASVAGLTGVVALVTSDTTARIGAFVALGAVVVALVGFLLRGTERSLAGELWLALTLPLAGIPVALASGVPPTVAAAVWGSFALAYVSGIIGVRAIIEGNRAKSAAKGWPGLLLVLGGIIGLLRLEPLAGGAALLFWLAVAGCRASRPRPQSLRRVGWLLVGASVLQAMWLLVSLR